MEETKKQPTCEERIDQELKARLEELLPDPSTWSVLKCAEYLKRAGLDMQTAHLDELRGTVRDLIRAQASDDLSSVEKVTTYKLCLSWLCLGDYFEIDWSEDCRYWIGGRYVLEDYSDSAERSISAEQAQHIADVFEISPDAA